MRAFPCKDENRASETFEGSGSSGRGPVELESRYRDTPAIDKDLSAFPVCPHSDEASGETFNETSKEAKKMKAVVNVYVIVDEMEGLNDQLTGYLNILTVELITLTSEDIMFAEEGESLDELPEWQREVVQEASKVLNSDDYIELPSQFDIHEYQIMEDFCYDVEDEELSAKLLNRIRGRGAFRNFKDAIHEYGIADDWYAFRAAAFKQIAVDWLEENDIPYTDTDE